ncbi:META domain-containing protein [Shewanella maritima]|uniref:META domain-containing protein n=1 Tax=Shewanella maritima TaxID=2520507 RepID=A0A411PJ89_9GAMM|nr:META domain-containing protein [Shewanella maritima]QBF83646.1 META domain-containing protein [Shewanella maritima]
MIKQFLAVSGLVVALTACSNQPTAVNAEQLFETLSGQWSVTDIAGEPVASYSKPRITFEQDGQLSGNNSCNRFSGRYEYQQTQLTLQSLGSTRKACVDGLVKQERMFMDSLPKVSQYQFAKTKLYLLDAQGQVLFELNKSQ